VRHETSDWKYLLWQIGIPYSIADVALTFFELHVIWIPFTQMTAT
jgi:hypothetical protein